MQRVSNNTCKHATMSKSQQIVLKSVFRETLHHSIIIIPVDNSTQSQKSKNNVHSCETFVSFKCQIINIAQLGYCFFFIEICESTSLQKSIYYHHHQSNLVSRYPKNKDELSPYPPYEKRLVHVTLIYISPPLNKQTTCSETATRRQTTLPVDFLNPPVKDKQQGQVILSNQPPQPKISGSKRCMKKYLLQQETSCFTIVYAYQGSHVVCIRQQKKNRGSFITEIMETFGRI